ncbi:MAG: ABC transporter permease subunit [Acidimicrobiales bacterium]|nr:ABC transporter permease subunit [Acidimicrobiales bacterium]
MTDVGAVLAPSARRGFAAGSGDRTWLPSVVLIIGLLVLWQVAALTFMAGSKAVPPVTDVVRDIAGDLDVYARHVRTTVREAWPGWLWGNLVATALGAIAVALPLLERPVLHVAVAVSSLPIIALGPILQVTLAGDAPRSALAGLAVFFTTLVGTIVGLRACDRASIDVIRALGGGKASVLRKVRIRAALPDYFTALKISAPAAVLGAIVGEFIGGSENGLGVALISARANADPARVWGIAVVATAVAGLGYAVIALAGRLLTPWAPRARRSPSA